MDNKIKLFEDRAIRSAWDEEKEEWYFSVVDVVGVLTDQPTQRGASNYWKVLKTRLKDEGNQLVTNCNQLKMTAADGKENFGILYFNTELNVYAAFEFDSEKISSEDVEAIASLVSVEERG